MDIRCSLSSSFLIPLPNTVSHLPAHKSFTFFLSLPPNVFYTATVFVYITEELVLDSQRSVWMTVSWWVQVISSDDWANQCGKGNSSCWLIFKIKMHFIWPNKRKQLEFKKGDCLICHKTSMYQSVLLHKGDVLLSCRQTWLSQALHISCPPQPTTSSLKNFGDRA